MASTKRLPTSSSELYSELNDGYNEENIEKALAYQEQFMLLKKNVIKEETIYSNEYIWAGKQDKIIYPLQQLDIVSKEELEAFIEMLQKLKELLKSKLI